MVHVDDPAFTLGCNLDDVKKQMLNLGVNPNAHTITDYYLSCMTNRFRAFVQGPGESSEGKLDQAFAETKDELIGVLEDITGEPIGEQGEAEDDQGDERSGEAEDGDDKGGQGDPMEGQKDNEDDTDEDEDDHGPDNGADEPGRVSLAASTPVPLALQPSSTPLDPSWLKRVWLMWHTYDWAVAMGTNGLDNSHDPTADEPEENPSPLASFVKRILHINEFHNKHHDLVNASDEELNPLEIMLSEVGHCCKLKEEHIVETLKGITAVDSMTAAAVFNALYSIRFKYVSP